MHAEEPLPPRLQQLIARVRNRLASVCKHMPAADFEKLVRQVAETEYRWEGRTGMPLEHPRE
jgi:hypothetical protein